MLWVGSFAHKLLALEFLNSTMPIMLPKSSLIYGMALIVYLSCEEKTKQASCGFMGECDFLVLQKLAAQEPAQKRQF